MSEPPAPAELLRDLAAVLSRWGGRWFLFGAQAVNVWRSPRLTADVDVTVFLDPQDPASFPVRAATRFQVLEKATPS